MLHFKSTYCAATLFGLASLFGAAWLPAADSPDRPPQRPLNVKPKPIVEDRTVKYAYDIVYVRAPRTVKGNDGKEHPAPVWPEIGHVYNLNAVTDLMLLHPDGTDEVLVAGGKGAIADPYVSFDGEWVYYWPSRNQGFLRFGGRFRRSSSLFLSGRLKRALRWIMAM